MYKSLLITVAITVLLLTTAVLGQIPGLLSYQGRLLDAVGDPVVDGPHTVEFRLWRDAVSTAPADELWTSNPVNVNTVDGLFSVVLGQSPMPPISAWLFVADTNIWLGITVGADPEMSPRSRLTSVGYSMFSQFAWQSHLSDSATGAESAATAEFADSTEAITDGAVDMADIGQAGAASGQVIKWNGSAWAVAADDAGGSGWNWADSSSHGPDSVLFADSSDHADNADNATSATSALFADSTEAITDGAVDMADIGQNGAVSGQILKWNGSAWVAAADDVSGGGSGGGWTDAGTVVRLDATSDSVGIGTSTPSEKLEVLGNFLISGQATLGQGHTNTGAAGFVAGESNSVTGKFASISGGSSNSAAGVSSVVGGGSSNSAIGISSSVGGGESNTTSGHYSIVAGGVNNTASGDSSSMGGGSQNTAVGINSNVSGGFTGTASGDYATVGGGRMNTSTAYSATVSGGSGNTADANYATVSGGNGNNANAASSIVGGGYNNTGNGVFSSVGGGNSNNASGSYSIVGGGVYDTASGHYSVVGGGSNNRASGDSSSVGGGSSNLALGTAATVSGGYADTASGSRSSIGGGDHNTASAAGATISGGYNNTASGPGSIVGGGELNHASGSISTIAGGQSCLASGGSSSIVGGSANSASGAFSTVAGGYSNQADGDYSFVAGRRARAYHDGVFVWADSYDGDVISNAANQFTARASGGVRFYTNTSLSSGVTLNAGGSSWSVVSDSTLKENFRPVDGEEILEKLSELDVTRWNYESQDESIEHIGPMAQDFYRLFGLGQDDTHINTLDPDGISLVAIKALYEKTKRIDDLESELAELRKLVEELIADQE